MSPSHPVGRAKAGFFLSFGFRADNPGTLIAALRGHAQNHDVMETDTAPFGTVFAIEGQLPAPDGRAPRVRAVWIVKTGEDRPRLVTVVPA